MYLEEDILRNKQLEGPELKKIIDDYEHGTPEETERWSVRGYIMDQGVLYRYTPDDDNDEAQFVIPASQRIEVIQKYHDAPTAGHYKVDHTYHKVLLALTQEGHSRIRAAVRRLPTIQSQ